MIDSTPVWLKKAAAFSWRYLLVLAAVYITFRAVAVVKVVVLPIILGLFAASVLSPLAQRLKARGWSPALATWGTILGLVPVVALFVLFLVPSFADGIEPLGEALDESVQWVTEWLSEGPLGLSQADIEGHIDDAIAQIQNNAGAITTGVLGGATVAFEIVTGLVLTLLVTFFYLKDGDRAYQGLLQRVSDPDRTRRGLEAAWRTLSGYVRGLAIVGLIDAIFIGIGLAIVGTPLVLPLMSLVFIGGFFPIIGAFISGLLAVAVSFVSGGGTDALIILAVVVGVQQFEGNVLHPIVFKKALSLHPLLILLAIGVGGVAFGIVGVFLAVPLTGMAIAVHQAVSDDPESSVVNLLTDRPYETTGRLEALIAERVEGSENVSEEDDDVEDGHRPE
ncbi:MAG: AI-2E family transporter [Acidimicrobiia bacterium]|nr:AI-2E family transporter [Acidimicrobiia bacterium]